MRTRAVLFSGSAKTLSAGQQSFLCCAAARFLLKPGIRSSFPQQFFKRLTIDSEKRFRIVS
jgi:hypothetical protein